MFDLYKQGICFAVVLCCTALPGGVEIAVNPQVTQSMTGGDDLAKLKNLTMAVGWEFNPNQEATAALKQLGIKKIRCINVDLLPGDFDAKGNFIIDTSKPSRLDAHLDTCTELGAIPHIIIGQQLPVALRIKAAVQDDGKMVMGGKKNLITGPSDYRLYRNYLAAYFEYVMVTKGFKNAEFETFNEPDIAGVICPTPVQPERGSAALYDIMFRLYSEIAASALQFEQKHPELRVRLGGPALAWAYTFRYGSFNWGERFVRDCAAGKLRLDFIGVHVYGNISSLAGEYQTPYPSFLEMLKSLQKVRDRYLPGTPIMTSEWGPSYHVNSTEQAMVNADNIGTAWSMEFLRTILENGIDGAMYLVTTDLYKEEKGKKINVWGWCSLMVNPQVYGHCYPKASYNLFTMIAALKGTRVESTRAGNINTFAVADPTKKKLQIIVWNFAARIPESGLPVDFSLRENVSVNVRNAKEFFGSGKVKATRKLIGAGHSNAINVYRQGIALTAENTALQTVDRGEFEVIDGSVSLGYDTPPSSVALIEIEPALN